MKKLVISRFRVLCLLAATLLLAAWMRMPAISAGMPFFYHEDEAHHFNRVAEMVKEGRFDPVYFHKPSLHFYLRMPVIAASFLWSVQRGHLRSIQEIETRNPFGLGKYAFAVSHSGIVKWNRAFSVLLILGSLVFVYLITARLTTGPWPALFATALAALSPDLIRLSAVIGVDVVLTFMATLTSWLALRWYQQQRNSLTLFSAICLCAGLTVSSKYNALPMMALPLLLAILCWAENRALLWRAIVLPWVGFLLGSPYILLHIPLFLDQLAYEIWHYGVAGHVGNMAEPGVAQALFYATWLAQDGIGVLGASLAGGVIVALPFAIYRSRSPYHIDRLIVLLFPILFAALMCAQKTNFTRNMLVFIPFASIAAGIALQSISGFPRIPRVAVYALAVASLLIPGYRAITERAALTDVAESRLRILDLIRDHQPGQAPDTAISGQLQLPSWVYRTPGVVRFSEEVASPLDLYLDGYDRIIVRADAYRSARGALLDTEEEVAGERGIQRVVRNPAISVLRFRTGAELSTALMSHLTSPSADTITCTLTPNAAPTPSCARVGAEPNTGEPYVWLTRRWTKLRITSEGPISPLRAITLSVRTPWQEQQLEVVTKSARHLFSFVHDQVGTWRDIIVPLSSEDDLRDEILLFVSKIHSPKAQGIGDDARRIGLAVRQVTYPPPLEKEGRSS